MPLHLDQAAPLRGVTQHGRINAAANHLAASVGH